MKINPAMVLGTACALLAAACHSNPHYNPAMSHHTENGFRNNYPQPPRQTRNVQGAGIMTEDGSESFNVFDNNFIVGATGTGARADERLLTSSPELGFEGSAYWFRGTNNFVRNNVAAAVYGEGFDYITLGAGQIRIPLFPGADPSLVGRRHVAVRKRVVQICRVRFHALDSRTLPRWPTES